MDEQWKDVVNYEGYYEVSNLGRVRSVDRIIRHSKGGFRNWRGKILKLIPAATSGYLVLRLSKEGIKKTHYVHHLVANAWLIGPFEGCVIRHGPNGISDNSVSNLCYGTKK